MFKNICKLTFALSAVTIVLSAADPMTGVWKLNTAKSKWSPGPGSKDSTFTYSKDGDWVVSKAVGVDGEGKSFTRESRYKLDGKEYPYDGPSGKGTINIKKINDYEFQSEIKGAGGANSTNQTVYSKDGKTRTLKVMGVNAKGQKLNHHIVYDRQ